MEHRSNLWRSSLVCKFELRSQMIRLLSKRQVAEIVQMHPESIMRLSREGKFPQFIKVGTGVGAAVRFLESDIEDWIKQKQLPKLGVS